MLRHLLVFVTLLLTGASASAYDAESVVLTPTFTLEADGTPVFTVAGQSMDIDYVDRSTTQLIWEGYAVRDKDQIIVNEYERWRPDWSTFETDYALGGPVSFHRAIPEQLDATIFYMHDRYALIEVLCRPKSGCRMFIKDELPTRDIVANSLPVTWSVDQEMDPAYVLESYDFRPLRGAPDNVGPWPETRFEENTIVDSMGDVKAWVFTDTADRRFFMRDPHTASVMLSLPQSIRGQLVRAMLNNVIRGRDDGAWILEDRLERAQGMVLITRLLGLEAIYCDEHTVLSSFPDIDQDAWYAHSMCHLVASGIVRGDDAGYMRPGDPLRVAEFMMMLQRMRDVPVRSSYPGEAWYEPVMKATVDSLTHEWHKQPGDIAQRWWAAAVLMELTAD